MGETLTLTFKALLAMTGLCKSTLCKRLAAAGIRSRLVSRKPPVKLYDVPPEFVLSGEKLLLWYEDKGYVTAQTLAERTGLDVTVVRGRLSLAMWPVEFREHNGTNFYKDTPELMEAVTVTKRERDRQNRPPETPRKNSEFKGEGLELIDEERRKRKWIGRKGRLVVRGHVVAEGIIESVSSCGVYLKGFPSKGDLYELELVDQGEADRNVPSS